MIIIQPTTTMTFLTPITYILLSALLYTGQCETYDDFVDRTLRQLCPYANFCSRNATKTLTNSKLSSCCLPCSCDKSCIRRNNCCPDYIGPEDDTSPKETCLPAAHIKNMDTSTRYNGYYAGIHFYHTVDRCSSQYPDQSTITRCMSPVPDDFISAARVSDSTGRVYWNRYCAICHGITDYKSWQLRIRYRKTRAVYLPQDFTKSNISSLLNMGFEVLSIPPKDHTGLLPRCYMPKIDTCNQTGHWEVFDPYLHRACNTYTFQYLQMKFTHNEMYKNPFCYLCNKWPSGKLYESCTVHDTSKTSSGEFSSIIDPVSHSAVQVMKRKRVCKMDEIYDPYFTVCRSLFCPIGTRPSYGSCFNSYTMSTGLSVVFSIAVDITIDDNGKSTSEHFKIQTHEDSETVNEAIVQKFGLSAKGCRFCISYLYELDQQTFGSPFLLTAKFTTTRRCTTRNMFEAVITNIDGRTFLVSLDNMNVTVTTAIKYGLSRAFPDLPEERIAHLDSYHSNLNCISALLIQRPKYYCPNLELTYTEYQQLMSGALAGSPATDEDFSVVNHPNGQDVSENTYKICIDDYLGQEKSSSVKSPAWILVLKVLVILHVLSVYNYISL